jgi:hypothetical protein
MRYSLLFFLLSVVFHSNGQSYDVKWGELQRTNGRLIYLLPNEPNEFYALRWSGGRLLGSYQVSRHEDLQVVDKGRIKLQAEGSMANFEGARIINGKFVVFLSDKRDGMNHFYMQEYNKDLTPAKEPLKLASYSLRKGGTKGWFDIKMSSNEKYFGVVWEIPGKKENRDRYGFKVFDENLNEINDGEYPLPFDAKFSKIHAHHISNSGDYFLAVTEYEEGESKRIFRNYLDYKALHIYHIAEDGLQDFTFDFQGKRIEAMAISSDDKGIFTITGLYGERERKGVSGVFYQQLSVATQEVLQEGFKEFDKEFITQGWSDRAKRKAKRREDRGKGEPQLYNYRMREVTILPDGSLVGTMEQYYVQVSTTTNTQTGQQTNTYYYYYNDIIAYKINSEGAFDWVKKVRKYQVSTNDGGPYSSYESFVDNGKIHFIFNDNVRNYDENGAYLDPERLYTANYSKKRNVVALAEIDLETGDQTCKTFFDRTDIQAIAVPKMFDVNYSTGEMLIYAIWGRKEKIGVLPFKGN